MTQKKLILFMPSIEGGGVEKNFVIISNYLGKKFKLTQLITADKAHSKLFKKLKIINPSFKLNSFYPRRLKYFFCLIELIKIITKEKNYVVFAFQANVYCALICKILNVKLIIRSNTSPSGWKLNFFRKKIFKILLSLPNEIIVNSLEFKNEYKSKFNLNPICILNPLDKDTIKEKSNEKIRFDFFQNYKGLKIIFIGRLVDQKDPLTFLKALSFIKNKINFRAVIIGKGYLYKDLKKFIEINDLSKQIKIINWKKNPYPYIKQSDTLVLTSKYEGLPNTLLEAIVLKKFIISTKCPTGPKEILDYGKGGELIEINDYKNLSKKIIEYNMNKKKFFKKVLFANKRLARFNYNKNLNKYSDIAKKYILHEK